MNPILAIADYPHADPAQPTIDALVGRRPAGQSILAPLGKGPGLPSTVEKELAACKADGITPVVWAGPPFADLDAGTVDFAALPDHQSVTDLVKLLEDFGGWVVVRLCYECANRKPDKTLRYESPWTFAALFDAIAGTFPANALAAWSYGPNGFPITFADWRPDEADLADVSMYGKAPRSLAHPSGKNAAAFVQVAAALGLPLIVGESGLMAKDYEGTPTGEALRADMKALVTWCVENDVRALAGPFSATSYGMVPWLGHAETEKYAKKAWGSPAFVTKPLAVAAQDPLVVAGIVAGGIGPVVDIDA